MVTKSGAHSTDFLAPESAEELTAKTEAAAVVRQITETNCGGRRTIRSKVASANRRFTILQPKWIGKADAFRAGRPSPIQGTTERRRTGCAAPPPVRYVHIFIQLPNSGKRIRFALAAVFMSGRLQQFPPFAFLFFLPVPPVSRGPASERSARQRDFHALHFNSGCHNPARKPAPAIRCPSLPRQPRSPDEKTRRWAKHRASALHLPGC